MQMGCFCSHSQHHTDDIKEQKETNRKINSQLAKDKQEYRSTHRLLLLGKPNRFVNVITIIDSMYCIVGHRQHYRISSTINP